jgi:murein L,D-transpeptidase YcbB/YkuD
MRTIHKVTTVLTLAIAIAIGGWSSARAWRSEDAEGGECTNRDEPTATLPDTVSDLRLVLNVPAYRLDVMSQGGVSRSIPVAVGQPKYRTPIGHYRIDYAVWNPWWIPPESDWARKERPQAPGWSNPVGRVKLHVTGLVFLHGTPLENSLGSAASHACVRMANADAIELARLIHSRAGPALPTALIDELVADTSRTRTIVLSRAVPVDIDYSLTEVQGEELVLFLDVYRYAGSRVPDVETQAMRALRAARGESAVIDVARLRTLIRASRRATVRLPLDSLIAPEAPSMPPLAQAR